MIPKRFDLTIELPMHPGFAYVSLFIPDGGVYRLVFDRTNGSFLEDYPCKQLDAKHREVLEQAFEFCEMSIANFQQNPEIPLSGAVVSNGAPK